MAAAGAAAFLLPQSQAGTFSANFNDNAAPAGTSVNGNTGDNNSGVIENGILKITKNANGKTGGFVIDDLDAGARVYGFALTAKVLVGLGSGTPADGFSLNFAPSIDLGATGGEEGIGDGLTVSFDEFVNADVGETTPTIDLKYGPAFGAPGNGTVIASAPTTANAMRTDFEAPADTFADLSLTVSPAGAVTLVYKGQTIYTNLFIPNYQPITGGRLAIVGRTGGLNENFWFDDVNLTTFTKPRVESQTVVTGSSVTFAPVLGDVSGATFEWLKNGSPISGETSQTLTLNNVALADSGAKYSLRVTNADSSVVTSDEGTLTVVDIPLAAPTASYDFTSADGSAPAGTTLYGSDQFTPYSGYISGTGGVNDSGVLHLTDAQAGQWGAIVVDDLVAGAPVYGITAHFKALVGGGTVPPADGFSFNFASDIPDPTNLEYENGAGTGLTIGFDIYDNGGVAEAPSIDVRYGGVLIAQQKVPISFIETGADFTDVLIRLENDGTLDVAYKGVVVFNNLLIPGFSQITGGRVLLGARTGGSTENIWIDDLAITPNTVAGDLRITTQPVSKYVVAGQSVTLSTAVNDSTGVTYQWNKNGAQIGGATSADYTFNATTTDSGATYTVTATRGGLTATSNPVKVTAVAINPTVNYTFDASTDVPAGTLVLRDPADTTTAGYIAANGGVNDSGVLHLTDAVNGQKGAFVIQPLLGGGEIAGFNAAFDVYIGGGTQPPADGFSFNWSPNLSDTIPGGDLEDGAGGDLTIGFDIFDNAGGEGPSIDVRWKGQLIAQTKLTSQEIQTAPAGDLTPTFRQVIIKLTPEGKLDLVYGDRILYTGLQLPSYAPVINGKYAFYARTGGLNANLWLDNVRIEAIKSVSPLRITTQPADTLLIAGQTATFSVGVSDPVGATYQWSRNGTPINGANSATYTTPQLAANDAGVSYSVTVTGPGGTVPSRSAILVAPFVVANPDVSLQFDGADTADAILFPNDPVNVPSSGYIGDGGVNGTSAFHLTDDVGGQGGALYFSPFDNGEPVSAFTATLKLLLRSVGSPADGISFVWANDITPTDAFGEDGKGSGLVVSLDTWDNGNGEAPALDIAYKGTPVATAKLPISALMTGDNYADFAVRLENDGTVDVQYNGRLIFSNVQLPNFTPLADAYFAIGGRTGGASADQWVDDVKIVTTSAAAGPTLNVTRNSDGSLTIGWTGAGTLEATSDLGGNQWTTIGATNPATIPTTGNMRFFRVVQ
jgi:hypothetical protein